jgi:hypothetical protein
VKRTSETLETSAVREEWVTEGTANEMSGVGRDVATLVVAVESKVETEEILEVLVLLAALAEHGSEVITPILVEIDLSRKSTATTVGVLVNLGRNGRQLSEEGDAVIEGRLPVVSLIQALLVGLCELGLVVEGGDGHGELGHGVKVRGEVVEHLGDEGGDLGLLRELTGELANLVGGRNLAGEEEPEHSLGEHLSAGCALGKLALAVLDSASVETDALVCIEDGALPDHSLQPAHTTQGVLDLDLTNGFVAVSLDLLKELTLGGNHSLEGSLEVGLGGGIAAGSENASDRLESVRTLRSVPAKGRGNIP